MVASTPGVRRYSGWPGRPRAPLAERPQVVEGDVVAGEVEEGVEEHRGMPGRQDEPVAIRPAAGSVGRVAQEAGPERVRHRRGAHRRAGMARVRLLDAIDREGPNRVDRQALEGGGQVGHRGDRTNARCDRRGPRMRPSDDPIPSTRGPVEPEAPSARPGRPRPRRRPGAGPADRDRHGCPRHRRDPAGRLGREHRALAGSPRRGHAARVRRRTGRRRPVARGAGRPRRRPGAAHQDRRAANRADRRARGGDRRALLRRRPPGGARPRAGRTSARSGLPAWT